MSSGLIEVGPQLAGVRRLLAKWGIDWAVLFGLLNRGWSLCAGPISAILIATRFTPELQGFYYTFSTLLALQVFVELGLGTVIVQFASHEWSKLSLDAQGRITGDPDAFSRLASIARFATRWYGVGAAAVSVGLGVGGVVFFRGTPAVGVNWGLPWLTLCTVAGVAICLVPVWSLLEGCNQLANVYRFRLVQSIVTSLGTWMAILAGVGLWTATIASLIGLIAATIFLTRNYAGFLSDLLRTRLDGPQISWRNDLFPMQWRIALSWVAGYFIISFFVPVIFKYHGPVVAGQMGMTWSIMGTIGAISAAWLSPQAPRFGMLIAQQRYEELDRQFWRTTRIIIVVTVAVALVAWMAVLALNLSSVPWAHRFAARLLPPLPAGLFLAATCLTLAISPFSVYLRAHKKEPLMVFSVIYAVLVGSSTLFFGKFYSVTGIAAGYLAINVVLMPLVVVIWQRCRAAWHVRQEFA